MRSKIPYIFLTICLLFSFIPTTDAQDANLLVSCVLTQGEHAGERVFLRYKASEQQLVLVSFTTGDEVQMLENGISTDLVEARDWSPDCGYFIASTGTWGEQTVFVWDVYANQRINALDVGGLRYTRDLIWSPANDHRLLLETTNGAYLWNLPNTNPLLLHTASDSRGVNFHRFRDYYSENGSLTWDYERHQLLGVSLADTSGVTAYDLDNGQVVAFYNNGESDRIPVRYALYGNEMLVFSDPSRNGWDGDARLWDRNTGSGISLDAQLYNGGRYLRYSPDGRYLALTSSSVFIWDLQNLAGTEPFVPAYTLPLRYREGCCIRAMTFEGDHLWIFSYYYSFIRIYDYNFQTGELLVRFYYRHRVCENRDWISDEAHMPYVEWACGVLGR
jgi:WD40 repeat protein